MVGGGQAGLAIGHLLSAQGRRFVILEAADTLGSAWRRRWASLVLFTPRRYDGLRDSRSRAMPDGHPGRDEVAAYLEAYAANVRAPGRVRQQRCGPWPRWASTSSSRSTTGRSRPTRSSSPPGRSDARACRGSPPISRPTLFQVHSAGYSGPGAVPAGTVLVVGGGNSGFQIAAELAATHTVHLSIGSRQRTLPQRLLGRDLLLVAHEDTAGSRRAGCARRDALIGSSRRALRRRGVPSGHARRARPRARSPSPTAPSSRSTRWCGRAATGSTTPGSISRSPPPTAPCASGGASRGPPASTSSACPGRARGVRRSWAGSRTTPSTSRHRSPPTSNPTGVPPWTRPHRPTSPSPWPSRDEPWPAQNATRSPHGATMPPRSATSSASSATTPASNATVPPASATRRTPSATRPAPPATRPPSSATRWPSNGIGPRPREELIGGAADALIRSALARRDAAWDRRQALHDREAGARGRAEAEHDRDAGASERVEAEHDRDAGASERTEAEHDRTTAFTDRGVARNRGSPPSTS